MLINSKDNLTLGIWILEHRDKLFAQGHRSCRKWNWGSIQAVWLQSTYSEALWNNDLVFPHLFLAQFQGFPSVSAIYSITSWLIFFWFKFLFMLFATKNLNWYYYYHTLLILFFAIVVVTDGTLKERMLTTLSIKIRNYHVSINF